MQARETACPLCRDRVLKPVPGDPAAAGDQQPSDEEPPPTVEVWAAGLRISLQSFMNLDSCPLCSVTYGTNAVITNSKPAELRHGAVCRCQRPDAHLVAHLLGLD